MRVNRGFTVTGTFDSFNQTNIRSTLSKSRFKFKLGTDSDPKLKNQDTSIFFGGFSSNIILNEIFEKLESIISKYYEWSDKYNWYRLDGKLFDRDDNGIILLHNNPWNIKHKVLILFGLGPVGTLACCKSISSRFEIAPDKKQYNAVIFLQVVNTINLYFKGFSFYKIENVVYI